MIHLTQLMIEVTKPAATMIEAVAVISIISLAVDLLMQPKLRKLTPQASRTTGVGQKAA